MVAVVRGRTDDAADDRRRRASHRAPRGLERRRVERPVGAGLLALADQQAPILALDQLRRRAEVVVRAGGGVAGRVPDVARVAVEGVDDVTVATVEHEDGVDVVVGRVVVGVAGADVDVARARVDRRRRPDGASIVAVGHRVGAPEQRAGLLVESDDGPAGVHVLVARLAVLGRRSDQDLAIPDRRAAVDVRVLLVGDLRPPQLVAVIQSERGHSGRARAGDRDDHAPVVHCHRPVDGAADVVMPELLSRRRVDREDTARVRADDHPPAGHNRSAGEVAMRREEAPGDAQVLDVGRLRACVPAVARVRHVVPVDGPLAGADLLGDRR